MGAEGGVPLMANDGAAKAYVHSLGEALHFEFKPLGVYVTVLAAGFTNTEVIGKFGLDPTLGGHPKPASRGHLKTGQLKP